MAAAKAEFLGQAVVQASTKRDVVKQGEQRVVALFKGGKSKVPAKAAAQTKKAATALKKAAAKVNVPNNEELAKWYGMLPPLLKPIVVESCNVT